MEKTVKFYKNFDQIRSEIYQAILSKDVNRILSWLNHCIEFFPPIIYDEASAILSSLKSDEHFFDVLRVFHDNGFCPELVYTYASQNASWHEGVYGVPIAVENAYDSNKIIIYSSKFSERSLSSQEAYKSTIEVLCAKYDQLKNLAPSGRPSRGSTT